MSKQTIEIEVPDGYRFIESETVQYGDQIEVHGVLVKKIIVPDFIKPGWWIARNKNGTWRCFENEPKITMSSWSTNGVFLRLGGLVHNLDQYDHIPWEETKTQQVAK